MMSFVLVDDVRFLEKKNGEKNWQKIWKKQKRLLVLFHDGDEQYYAEPEDHHHQQLGKLISSVVLDGAVY